MSEPGNPAHWYLRTSSGQSGPFSLQELHLRFAEGRLDSLTLVRREGYVEWMSLGQVVAGATTPVQVIELTSKRWKGQMLLAAILALWGAAMVVGATLLGLLGWLGARDGIALAAGGLVFVLAGVVWFAVARGLAWWYHG